MKQKHQTSQVKTYILQQSLLQNTRKAGAAAQSSNIDSWQAACCQVFPIPALFSPVSFLDFAGSPDPCLMDSPAVLMPPAAWRFTLSPLRVASLDPPLEYKRAQYCINAHA
jgi:hypothetical protein